MWWFLACASRLTGSVVDEGGTPVAGAVLDAPGCDAVTDDNGRYSVSCPPGSYSFSVSHPDTLVRVVPIDAPRGTSEVPTVTLVRKPVDPGLYVHSSREVPAFTRLGPTALLRRESKSGATARQNFCVGDRVTYSLAPSGEQEIWENRDVEWRLFALDAEGCAWEVQSSDGTWWEGVGKPIDAVRTETRSEGRSTHHYVLPDGDYVFAEWYAGFLVQDGESYRAYGLRVGPATPG